MIDEKANIASVVEGLNARSVVVYMGSKFIVLSGDWQWDMLSDAVYCSDVMLQLPPEFLGTKGIIHPDDMETVEEKLESTEKNKPFSLEFRIITTYGNIKNIAGKNILPADTDEEAIDRLQKQVAGKGLQELQDVKEKEELLLRKEIYEQAERLLQTGTWYVNTSTNTTYYADNVYRIYGLPPQSLNAHPNTFVKFIHPQDSVGVKDAFDLAYKDRLPLELEFRIITADDKLKYVRQTTNWKYGIKGEEILFGILQDVTDLKQLEDEQEKAENIQTFQASILNFNEQALQTGTWQINLLTRQSTFSENFYRLFGLRTLPNLSSNSLVNLVHPDDREAYIAAHKKILTGHTAPDIEFRIIRLDGNIRYLRQRGKLMGFGEEEMVMIGTLQDITAVRVQERKIFELKENALVNEEAFKQAEDVVKIGTWIWDLDTGQSTWSSSFYAMLGYRKNTLEITQKIFTNFIHLDDKKEFNNKIKQTLNKEETETFNFRVIAKGEEKFLKATFSLSLLEDKTLFIGVIQDVTEEQILKNQLLDRVHYAEVLNDTVKDRVIITDVDHNIIEWNNSSRKTYNLKKEEVLGKNIFEVFPKLKNPKVTSYIQAALNGETVFEKGLKAEHSKGYFDLYLVPMKDEQGAVTGILHFLHDVTKEIELQQGLSMRLGFIEKILEASIDRIIVMDKNMNYLLWNKKCEEHYGLKKEQVIGKNILEIFPGVQNEITHVELKKALRGETIHISAKKGLGGKYEEVYLIPIKDEKQEVTAVLWVLHDLSKEYALVQHQKKTNEVLDALNECYIELDNNFRFSYVNTMAEGFFEKRREDLLGKEIWELYPNAVGTPVYDALVKTFEEGIRTTDEFVSPFNGHYIYMSCAPTMDGIVVMFYDIQEIKENRLFIEQVMEATPDFVMVYNLVENKIEFVNRSPYGDNDKRYNETFKLTYEGILERAHPDDREGLHNFIQDFKTASDREIRAYEYRVVDEEELTWYRARGKVFKRDAEGNVTHYISIVQDFTDEMVLRRQLAERTRHTENLIDASIDRMFVLDKEFIVHAWNKKCEEYYDKTKEEVLGNSLLDIFPKVKESMEIMNAIELAFKGEHTYVPASKELYIDKITERFYVPLIKEDGTVHSVLCVLHDLTTTYQTNLELKELNISLQSKNAELLEKNEEITNFAFVASHDLKEPIRKIHFFTHFLLEQEAGNIGAKGRSYLNKMNASVERLNFLMEDILALTRIHSEKIQKPERVDLNIVLEKAVEELKENIVASGAEIEAATLPVVNGKESQLVPLIKNLLSNAIKFHKDGEEPRVSITVENVELKDPHAEGEVRKYFRLSFIDDGIGFNDNYLKKVFAIFQRLQNDFEGTGIGLAICKKVMENHNGFITAESKIGEGSTFCCFFPEE